jgi:hypothetical protein
MVGEESLGAIEEARAVECWGRGEEMMMKRAAIAMCRKT